MHSHAAGAMIMEGRENRSLMCQESGSREIGRTCQNNYNSLFHASYSTGFDNPRHSELDNKRIYNSSTIADISRNSFTGFGNLFVLLP